ncbi:HDIG domain-containing protein [Clostridium sp. cel8]|jgi:putative nucleotidyltransferase with HDIG domain|uniref:HDIG domain-containing metalloprotein n=1 Tax=unclassified Clostridium TaxID=2614128 RepID=UPI0015F41CBB|nr:HDIG domain-containing metalloprotein [Clostridium sp. cel8]MBA5851844.1 HDIG domain-containing protein [Clostridium sp. cel8]
MFFYRIKQFYWNLCSKINDNDLEFLRNNLNETEMKLFNKLSLSERKHSIRVAYDVEKICYRKNMDSKLLIKAALFHDIGKSLKRLNIIDKSIMVLLDKFTFGKMKKFNNCFKISKINIYYYHSKLGADILRKSGFNEKIIYFVENHDNKNIKDDKELNILKYCDNNN